MASVLNYHRSPSPGGRESRLLFSDYLIDIVLAPSQIKVHPCGLAPHLLLLLLQFQELMQLAAPPCLSSLPPLTGILGCSRSIVHSSVGMRPASSFLYDIRRRGRQLFSHFLGTSSSKNNFPQISSLRNNFAPTLFDNCQSQFSACRPIILGSLLLLAGLCPSSQNNLPKLSLRFPVRLRAGDSRLFRDSWTLVGAFAGPCAPPYLSINHRLWAPLFYPPLWGL